MSQNSLSFQKASPVQSLIGLARQIALPHEFAPQRFPSFPALERTAVMGFNATGTLPVDVSSANGPIKIMVSRQAAWPLWADQLSTDLAYSVSFPVIENSTIVFGANTEVAAPVGTTLLGWRTGTVTQSPSVVGMTGSAPPFQYPLMGVDSDTGPMPYVFVPKNAWWMAVLSASTPVSATQTSVFTICVEQWNSPGQVTTSAAELQGTISPTYLGGATTSFKSDGDWIRIPSLTIRSPTSNTSTFDNPQLTIVVMSQAQNYTPSNSGRGAITQSTLTPIYTMLPLFPPREFVNSRLPWFSTRTTAAAALFTNVTQVLNKGGTVLAGRVSPQIQSPFKIDSTYISTLHPAEKNYLPLETGFYTYAPPSTDLTDFWDYTIDTYLGAPHCPTYRLDNSSLVNIAYFDSPSAIESLAVNLDWHIEFRTTSALFQVGMSALTLESLHQAQLALAQIGFFFPNETHKSLISKVINTAQSWAKAIMPMALAVSPQLNAAYKTATAVRQIVLSNQPKPPPATTSGKTNGMMGGTVVKKPTAKRVVVKKPGKKK